MKKNCLLFTLLIFFLSPFFSEGIINPVPGKWGNKQVLVVDSPSTASVYYSLSAEDPEKSGIAYDGPALIDMAGNVLINVAVVEPDGKKSVYKVNYTVDECNLPDDEEAHSFLEENILRGAIDYSAGEELIIPSSLEYSLEQDALDFDKGSVISMDKKSIISRNMPLTLSDGKSLWRFIIKVRPSGTGIFTRKDLPFEIEDWTKLVIKDRKQIYKIDDSWWQLPKHPVKLDRSVSHMISWQDINYSPENIVKYFVLPPKPQVKTETADDGMVSVYCQGQEGYKFAILDSNGNPSELFDQITVDTFRGDNFKGRLESGIYYDSLYQGKIAVNYDIHKKVPSAPVITSSVPGSFIRKNTKIQIQSSEKNKIYVSIAGPVILDDDYSLSAQEALFDLATPDFILLKKNSFNLTPSGEGAAAYRILAYCMDSSGLKSKVSEYNVVIDTCNYYIDGTDVSETAQARANGSREAPYTSLQDVVPLLKNSRYVRLRIVGDVFAPNEKIIVDSNCTIDGKGSARILVGPHTTFDVRNSSVTLNDVLVTLAEHNDSESSSLFNLQRGVLYLNNSEISCLFGKNGTIINSDSSVVNIENSGLTSTASVYSSVVNAVQSKIMVKKSRITAVADTAVNFSSQGGLFELSDSVCKVTGSIARTAELFDTYSSINGNSFSASLKNGALGRKAVYFEGKKSSVTYERNSESGF